MRVSLGLLEHYHIVIQLWYLTSSLVAFDTKLCTKILILITFLPFIFISGVDKGSDIVLPMTFSTCNRVGSQRLQIHTFLCQSFSSNFYYIAFVLLLAAKG